ncbi:hypothetical protein JS55_08095 (plasmid) [Rickettsia felis str. LSU]|nr:hypothetical protein JS55_08095 [Rickettsia felis str. LSU]
MPIPNWNAAMAHFLIKFVRKNLGFWKSLQHLIGKTRSDIAFISKVTGLSISELNKLLKA